MASASYSRPTRVGFEALKSRIVAPVARTTSIACVNRFWDRRQFVRPENMPWILFDSRRTAASANHCRQIDYSSVSWPPNAKGRPWQDAQADPQTRQV